MTGPTHEEKAKEIGYGEIPEGLPAELRELLEKMRAPNRFPPGLRWIDRLATRSIVHTNWMERAYVDADPAKIRALRNSIRLRITWVVVAAGAWGWALFTGSETYLWVTGGLVGCLFGTFAHHTRTGAMSYWSGWNHGRIELMKSYSEAMDRGMTFDEWLSRLR